MLSIWLCEGGHKVDLLAAVPSKLRRAQICSRNPAGAALYFDRLVRAFIDAFLGWRDGGDSWATRGRTHNGRPSDWQRQRRAFAGLVLAFFGVVEPQERQSEHLHMLVWVAELIIGDLQVYMQDADRCRSLFAYLDRMVSESLPEAYKPSAPATAGPPAADEATADASPGVDSSAEPGAFARPRSGCARSGCAGSCRGAHACGPAEQSTGAAAEATTGAPATTAPDETAPGVAPPEAVPEEATADAADPDVPPRKRLRRQPDAEPAPSDDEELPDAPMLDAHGLGPAADEMPEAWAAFRDQLEALPAEQQRAEIRLGYGTPQEAARVATVLRDNGFEVGHNRDASAALPCNQNVTVLVTGPDAVATIYYITNYMTKMGYTKESLANQSLLALARLDRRISAEEDADMAGEERLRRSMISVLNGAARGVTFGGPLVGAGAGITPV